MAIQIRRGTNAEWESNNSNIVVGEPAIATDEERFFVGTDSGAFAEFANLDIIAPAYDTSTSYEVGDVINRQGKLYSCNTPCSGVFNATYWDEKSLTEILKDLENEIDYAQYEIGYADGKLITIDNGAGEIPVKDLTVDIEAVQDLHGYDAPWVGGAGKNLYDDSQALLNGYITETGSVGGTSSANNKHTYKIPIVGGETYTYSVSIPYSSSERYCGFYDSEEAFISSVGLLRNTTSITFTAPSNAVSISLTIYNADGQKVQLEKGSTATAWTPYENICPISGWDEESVTRTGKNLLGGNLLRDGVLASMASATDDAVNRTVTFASNATIAQDITQASGLTGKFKANTQYTFIMTIYKTSGTSGNLRIYYTDGTYSNITGFTAGQKGTVVVTSSANKTVSSLSKYNSGGSTVLYYDESGVFEGVLTATDFEPYNGNTYSTNVNLYDGSTYKRGYFNNGKFAQSTNAYCAVCPCEPNTDYVIRKMEASRFQVAYSKEAVANGINIYGLIEDNTATEIKIKTGEDAEYLIAYVYYSTLDSSTITLDEMLASVRVVKGTTYPVTWEDAGTVYGGTFDVTTGVLTVTHKKITLDGTQTINASAFDGTASNVVARWSLSDYAKSTTDGHAMPNAICDKLKAVERGSATSFNSWKNDVNGIGTFTISTNGQLVAIALQESTITNGETLNTWLSDNPITAVYELATPQTYQLTPTQVRTILGTNNIWNDMNSKNELVYRISNALN